MHTVVPAVEPEDVLVAVNTGATRTPFFPILAGVVLDEGSFGEQSCGIARECGIPVDSGTRSGTQALHDGDWVTVDGEAGIVEIQANPAQG